MDEDTYNECMSIREELKNHYKKIEALEQDVKELEKNNHYHDNTWQLQIESEIATYKLVFAEGVRDETGVVEQIVGLAYALPESLAVFVDEGVRLGVAARPERLDERGARVVGLQLLEGLDLGRRGDVTNGAVKPLLQFGRKLGAGNLEPRRHRNARQNQPDRETPAHRSSCEGEAKRV